MFVICSGALSVKTSRVAAAHEAGVDQGAGKADRAREKRAVTLAYAVLIEPLAPEDGGGFLARVPDVPGCMSDGETPDETLANVRGAIETGIEAAGDVRRLVPAPTVPPIAPASREKRRSRRLA